MPVPSIPAPITAAAALVTAGAAAAAMLQSASASQPAGPPDVGMNEVQVGTACTVRVRFRRGGMKIPADALSSDRGWGLGRVAIASPNSTLRTRRTRRAERPSAIEVSGSLCTLTAQNGL